MFWGIACFHISSNMLLLEILSDVNVIDTSYASGIIAGMLVPNPMELPGMVMSTCRLLPMNLISSDST
jgi:hypothetical protein